MESNNLSRNEKTPGSSRETIIWIDLGTTNSCASIIRNEKRVEIIPENNTGKTIIPSMVVFKKEKKLIGTIAKNYFREYPELTMLTMFNSKRLLGRKFNNKQVQKDIKNWPVKVIEDKETGKPQYVIKIENKEKKYFPEDVSSMILKYIKKYS